MTRPLLLPLSSRVDDTDAYADPALAAAGFDLRITGPDTVSLRGIPACLAELDARELLAALAGRRNRDRGGAGEKGPETLLAAVLEACDVLDAWHGDAGASAVLAALDELGAHGAGDGALVARLPETELERLFRGAREVGSSSE